MIHGGEYVNGGNQSKNIFSFAFFREVKMQALGTHFIGDLYECVIPDEDKLLQIILEAIDLSGATVVSNQNNPLVSDSRIVVLVEESHFILNLDRGNGMAFLDVFTCGSTVKPDIAFDFIAKALKAKVVDQPVAPLARGQKKLIGEVLGDFSHKPLPST